MNGKLNHMKPSYDFDAKLRITLRRDEAIVLQSFLAREILRSEPGVCKRASGILRKSTVLRDFFKSSSRN